MHIATFMKWLETCDGKPLQVVMILPFDTCQGSKISSDRSSFGMGLQLSICAAIGMSFTLKLHLCSWSH